MSTSFTLMFRQSLVATLLLGALASGQNAAPPQAALPGNAGVAVDEVRKGSNAEQAGLQVGDDLDTKNASMHRLVKALRAAGVRSFLLLENLLPNMSAAGTEDTSD